MKQEARIIVLERAALFRDTAPPTLSAAAEFAHELPFGKGDHLFLQGDEADYSYLLAWGRLRLDQTTADGQNVVLRYLGPGDMVGTVAVLRRKPYPATPVAIEDGVALYWSAAAMAELIAGDPRLAANVIDLIGGRLDELQERMQEIATQRVERRIAATLLRMVRHSGRRVEEGVEIPHALSRHELAEMNGTTLFTVSRTLAAWEQDGVIGAKRKSHIVILKPHRLVEIAEQA